MQKLIYQTKYSNLQIVSSSQSYQNFWIVVVLIVVMSHLMKVALQSVQIVDQRNDLLLLTVVKVALVINLGNREQLIFVSNIFFLNLLKVLF